MAIDVGSPAISRANTLGNYTAVFKDNPANATGTIDHIEIWAWVVGDIHIASFDEVSTNTLTTTGYVLDLTVVVDYNDFDAPGDFTAFDINEGDYIGRDIDGNATRIDCATSGGAGMWYTAAGNIPCSEVAFTSIANWITSVYATGTESGGEDITVYPDAQTLVDTLESPSLSLGVGISPDELGLTGTIETPVINFDYIVIVSEVSIAGTLESPSIAGEAIIAPSALSLIESLNLPNILFDYAVAVSALTLTGTLEAPSVVIEIIVTPSALDLAGTLHAPSVLIEITVFPSTIAMTGVQQAALLAASGIYNRFSANVMNKVIDLEADIIKVMLLNNSHSFIATHNVKSDIDANEISGTGYTTGGAVLANKAITQGGSSKWAADNVTWSDSTITAYYAVIYDDTVGTKDLIASIDFGGAQSSVGESFTIEWDVNGIIALT